MSGGRDSNIGPCGKYSIYAAVQPDIEFIESFIGTSTNGGSEGQGGAQDGTPNGEQGGGSMSPWGSPTAGNNAASCNASGRRASSEAAFTLAMLGLVGAARRRRVKRE